jgi:hypothetical protein
VYEAHYGLDQRPFGETVAASAYLALPSRDACLRRLRYGLEHGPVPPYSSARQDPARPWSLAASPWTLGSLPFI